MERTLTALRKKLEGDVYIFLRDAEIGRRFLQDAEREGFTVGGDRPTTRPYAAVMALHEGTVCCVGAVGNIRFQCGDTARFHRVDYERYVAGAKRYGCRKPRYRS